MAITVERMQKRNPKAPQNTQANIDVDEENEQTAGSLELRTMIKRRIAERMRKREQAKLEEELLKASSEKEPINPPASGISGAHLSADLEMDDHDVGDDGTRHDYAAKEPLHGSGDVPPCSDQNDGHNNEVDDARENASEQGGQHKDPMVDQDQQTATTHPFMTPQEAKWWAMTFEELYQHARSKNFGKTGTEGRKSGRIKIIKWLCEREGIIPYIAPSITPPVEATPIITRPNFRPNGSISHPEAILRTSDPALQRMIDEAEKKYRCWPAAELLALAMQRSYQLLKDSNGKLPSKSISAMANWLAAWDVLKSPREKKWWLGDGIDLVNRAKAMGYQGPSRKYEAIVWLRSTAEDAEVEVVAEPTPNKAVKRKAEEPSRPVSKRPAKGSKRPNGWDVLKFS